MLFWLSPFVSSSCSYCQRDVHLHHLLDLVKVLGLNLLDSRDKAISWTSSNPTTTAWINKSGFSFSWGQVDGYDRTFYTVRLIFMFFLCFCWISNIPVIWAGLPQPIFWTSGLIDPREIRWNLWSCGFSSASSRRVQASVSHVFLRSLLDQRQHIPIPIRPDIRSGWKVWLVAIFSPVPVNPDWFPSNGQKGAAPPRVSPSIFGQKWPVTSELFSQTRRATLAASWPIMASTTKRFHFGRQGFNIPQPRP